MKKILFFNIALIFILFINNYSHALCVNVPNANLRSGPGTKYEKIQEISRFTPLKELEITGNWYKVKDAAGNMYWIYKKLVTNRFKCAVVEVDVANIRSGPGKSYLTVYTSPAMKYEAFKIINNKGSWIRVKDEFGSTGWMFKDLLWIQ